MTRKKPKTKRKTKTSRRPGTKKTGAKQAVKKKLAKPTKRKAPAGKQKAAKKVSKKKVVRKQAASKQTNKKAKQQTKKKAKVTKVAKVAKVTKKAQNQKIQNKKTVSKKQKSEQAAAVAPVLQPLYKWYAGHKRELPFRATTDFYPVWVSEIMLQQTRVAAMLPRYEEFMRRFPTIESLAAATEEEVLAAWRGLGYYTRAKNLRLGAQQVVNEHGGKFPADEKAARKIKGVGEYTAAAILSIAYRKELPVFDGNVRRVISRLFHPRAGSQEETLKLLAGELLKARGRTSPGDHNQAMMELGAVICVPGQPDCPACPLKKECQGLAAVGGMSERSALAKVPPSKKDDRAVELEMRVYYLYEPAKDLVWVAREADSRFFKNLWFFPVKHRVLARTGDKKRGKSDDRAEYPDSPGLDLVLEAADKGRGVKQRMTPGSFSHGITHHTIRGRIESLEIDDPKEGLWTKLQKAAQKQNCEWQKIPADDLQETVVSSIAKKILPAVRSKQPSLF